MQRFASRWFGWLLLFGALAESTTVTANASQPDLVIIGASYAADWGRPNLPGFSVINRGVGGDETSAVRARFERDVLAAKPAAVLIWGHINNIHRAPPGEMAAVRERIKEDVRDMVKRARDSGITVYLATEVTLPEAVGFGNRVAALIGSLRGKQSYAKKINTEVIEVNHWLRAFARQQNLRLFDFERAFDDGAGFRRREFSKEDGSHISPEGYAALTRYAQEQLAKP